MTLIEQWERLCSLLDDDPELAPGVRLALDDPEAYAAARAVDTGADEVDPWTALIDGLDDAGALAYLDEDDTGDELADALVAIPRIVRADIDLEPLRDVDGGIPEAARVADSILEPVGLSVVWLEEGSDAYPLVVVPSTSVAEITTLASELGHVARSLS